MSSTLPGKLDVANQLLRKGSLFIHLDPRVADVVVPPWLRHQAQLVLQVGLDMPIPINDLRVDHDGIFGTLSFSRSPFGCNIPWSAIFALVGDEGRGMVWPESMPSEIVAEVERETERAAKSRQTSIPPLPLTSKPSPAVTMGQVKTPVKTKTGRLVPPWLKVHKGGSGS